MVYEYMDMFAAIEGSLQEEAMDFLARGSSLAC